MILDSLDITKEALEARTGWAIKPEGACKGDICVPLPAGVELDGRVDVAALAERLSMPLIHDEDAGAWALGPEAMGRALTTAQAPEIVLPDLEGNKFRLSSLRGQKVVIVAWASY